MHFCVNLVIFWTLLQLCAPAQITDLAADDSRLVKQLVDKLRGAGGDFTRPGGDGDIVQVEMSVNLLGLRSLNKRTEEAQLYVEETYTWHDPRVNWLARDFGGVTAIRLPHTAVWTPDIYVTNGISLNPDTRAGYVRATSDGRLTWSPRSVHALTCSPTKPFSRRNRAPDWWCHLLYQSTSFGSDELNITHTDAEGMALDNVNSHANWKPKRTGVRREEDNGKVTLDYKLLAKEVPYTREEEL